MQIIEMRPVMKGVILANATIVLPKWGNFFIKIMVFEKGSERWIAFPSEPYEKDGKKMYSKKCGYEDREMTKKFEDQFFKVFDEYIKTHPLQITPKKDFFSDSEDPFALTPQQNEPWY